jgi:hypothetical protein
MDIIIKTVSNNEVMERMGFTGADWWFDEKGDLQVRIANLGNWKEEAILGIHEASEGIICKQMKITHEDVDEFDKIYQITHEVDNDSGDELLAPYKWPHTFATAIERVLAGVLRVDWKSYDDKLSVI